MGNLSNLYVSQSFQSLIHLGTNGVATPSLTTLQDGYGNSIGIEVNTAGDLFLSGSLTASLQQGYVWVGNASGKTTTVSTSSFGGGGTTPAGTISSSAQITALGFVSSSITASSLITASVSGTTMTFTKGNGTTFNVTLPTGSGGTINTGSFITNIQNNNLTPLTLTYDNAGGSTNVTLDLPAGIVSGSSQLTSSYDLRYALSGSGGGTINTASFATTGSNTFRGDQIVLGDIRISGSTDNHLFINRPGGGDILRLGVSNNGNTFDFHITGSADQQLWLIDNQGGTWLNTFFGGIQSEGKTTINAPFTASQGAQINGGDLRVANNLTASLQQGYVWVGNSSGRTTTVPTSSFAGLAPVGVATTGSNSFNGDQNVTGSVRVSQQLQIGSTNLGPSMQSLDSGTPAGFTGLQINAGESGSFSMRTLYGGGIATATLEAYNTFPNPNSGGKISAKSAGGIDVFGYGGDVIISGSNTTIQGLRYPNTDGTNGQVLTTNGSGVLTFTTVSGGSINTGSFAITGSNTFRGNQTITGSVFISSSGGLGLSNTDGANVQYFGNSFGSNIGLYKVSDATEIGLALDGAAWTTNWANGPIIYVNNTPGDTYEGVFGFQNKTNYTDGRITALKPLDVRGNTTITGSLTISSSAATDLAVIGNSVFTGNTTITGSTPSLTIRGTNGVTTQFPDSLSISSSLYRNLQGPRGIEFLKSTFDYNTFLASYTALSSSLLSNFTDNLSATASYTVGVFDNAFTQDVELSLETTTTNGILFKDIRSDTGAYTTFLKIAPNGGTNPPLEFKRGIQITGSLSIQSGSALPVSTGSAILTWNASTGQVTQAPFSSILSASVSSGEFWSTTTQSGSAGVSGSIQFNNSGSFYNTSVVNGTQLQVANGGVYNIQFSAQIETSAGADTLWIWFKKNGNNIGASASKAVLANNTAQIMTVNILDEAAANDYYEIAYQNLNGHATVLAEAASGNIPAIPSVIATIFQIR